MKKAGLGLRREFIRSVLEYQTELVDFYEVAPENWMRVGGRFGKQFRALTERASLFCHGLSLSLGGIRPLDNHFLLELKDFLYCHHVTCYSEHLSYCSDQNGYLYDLMPIPFTEEAVVYVAERIRHVQNVLERRIAIENISYYAAPGQELSEIDFLQAVLTEADCDILLDVNNVYVNSVNHGYKAEDFINAIPGERIAYLHIAGHYMASEDLLVDTHGAAVVDPVWSLLEHVYARLGPLPTLLERDFNIPPLPELLQEVNRIRVHQNGYNAS